MQLAAIAYSHSMLLQVYTILCRTTFRSFACTDIDDGEAFHQNE
jgi:hypothetical protein